MKVSKPKTSSEVLVGTFARNYALVRKIIPNAVWFSELTGINERVAGNVLSGTRPISIRHIIRIEAAFGLLPGSLEFPLVGNLDYRSSGNLARRRWLSKCVEENGGIRRVSVAHPGIGGKTVSKMVGRTGFVSPIMCELISRHTGWVVAESLLDDLNCEDDGPQLSANSLLQLMRLANHRANVHVGMPPRMVRSRISVPAGIRYAAHDFDHLIALVVKGEVDVLDDAQREWLKQAVTSGLSERTLSEAEAKEILVEVRKRRQVARRWPDKALKPDRSAVAAIRLRS
ncbi:hypothetical protein C7S18_23765 (plasmid) [Ahniella affigens]|uniref:Uncharacterized protein n=1 Tax=Ahniella affigens TaxID=2021234 RepID=A0A2P1PZQ0_9GAMM|nr:hypothetical protein [Ahniella affigens]AVQ00318.1 hypothetical protein C7S18_23765 [Ahniella affigens]